MKKLLIIGSVAVVTLIALGIAGFAFAQAGNPPTPQAPVQPGTYQNAPGAGVMSGLRAMLGRGRSGMMAGAGMMGYRMGFQQGMHQGWGRGFAQGTYGPLHETMIAALATRLNLTVEDLQAKISAGERPYEIAQGQGLTDDQIQALMEEAHDEALQAAVAAGVLTQDQAARMDQMMEQMGQGGMHGWQSGGFRGQRKAFGQAGLLHEYKTAALAEALGLTAEQVETRLLAGESMLEIAAAQGLTAEEFQLKMVEVSKSAIDQALADGKLTQEQADWMRSRVEQMQAGGFGPAGCPGMAGWR